MIRYRSLHPSACRGSSDLSLAILPVVSFVSFRCCAQTCFNGPDLDARDEERHRERGAQVSRHVGARRCCRSEGQRHSGNRRRFRQHRAGGGHQQAVSCRRSADDHRNLRAGCLASQGPLPRADFYCGIYNSPDRIGFFISNLPPGRYALVFQKVAGKDPITLTLILQEVAGAWKLAGYYPRLDSIGGHDGQWYLAKAREFKAKGQSHNAWFYYLTAWDLLAPVNFMSTPQLDKVADEMQAARPSDLPSAGVSAEPVRQWQSVQDDRNDAGADRRQSRPAHRLPNS